MHINWLIIFSLWPLLPESGLFWTLAKADLLCLCMRDQSIRWLKHVVCVTRPNTAGQRRVMFCLTQFSPKQCIFCVIHFIILPPDVICLLGCFPHNKKLFLILYCKYVILIWIVLYIDHITVVNINQGDFLLQCTWMTTFVRKLTRGRAVA